MHKKFIIITILPFLFLILSACSYSNDSEYNDPKSMAIENPLSIPIRIIFPGSFNPFTRGHLTNVEYASLRLAREDGIVWIIVADNPSKKMRMFDKDNIAKMIEMELHAAGLANVFIDISGVVGEGHDSISIYQPHIIMRAFRNKEDLKQEALLINRIRKTHPELCTDQRVVLLESPSDFKHISSTLVRNAIQGIKGYDLDDLDTLMPKVSGEIIKTLLKDQKHLRYDFKLLNQALREKLINVKLNDLVWRSQRINFKVN